MSVYIKVLRGPQTKLIHAIYNFEFHNHSLYSFKKREIIVFKPNFLNNKMYQSNSNYLYFYKGPFKYYVIKEVGGLGQKMAIFDDLQYCKSSKMWVGGPKKVQNMMM